MLTNKSALPVLLICLSAIACGQPAPPPAPPAPKPPPIQVGGDYGPVQTFQLLGKHVCEATGRTPPMFHWNFTDDTFEMLAADARLPPEVIKDVLGKERDDVMKIEGKWRLDDRLLKLSDLKADGQGGFPDVDLKPFRTPIVRIHFGERQYVLGQKK